MDQAEKKALDANWRYLLENVSMTQEFYGALTEASIFTNEMLNKIWSHQTNGDRIGELVEQLKRRGDESFAKFLGALRCSQQEFIADHLFHRLCEQVTDIRSSPECVVLSPESRRHVELSKLSKDELIKRVITREDDYNDLNDLHDNLKNDFQLTLDELSCLREVTQSLRHANELEQQANNLFNRHGLNAGQLDQTIREKEREISECYRQIEDIESQLSEAESSLSKNVDGRRRLANKLKLRDDATHEQIAAKIDQLKQDEATSRERVARVESEMTRLQKDFDEIDEQKNRLTKRIQFLNQKVQTLDLQKKKHEASQTYLPQGSGRSPKPFGDAEVCTFQQPSRINIIWPSTPSSPLLQRSKTVGPGGVAVAPGRVFPPLNISARYCILCRQVYHNRGNTSTNRDVCRIHYRAFREDGFECCRDKVPYSAGCLTVRHLYVDVIKANKNSFYAFTDGENFRVHVDRRGFSKAHFG